MLFTIELLFSARRNGKIRKNSWGTTSMGNDGRSAVLGGIAVLPDAAVRADILIEDGRIAEIAEAGQGAERWTDAEAVDAEGTWVLPGLVDIHCDAIEKETEPRPGTLFPMEMAFLQFERKL